MAPEWWDFSQTYWQHRSVCIARDSEPGKQAAFIYARQPMLRYNMSAPGGKLMVALENPEDGFGSHSYGDQSYPDLVARYGVVVTMVLLRGCLLRQLEDDAAEETKTASAVSLSARIPTFGHDDLRLQYSYGALGRYMGLFTYPDVDLAEQAAGEVEPLKTYGVTAACRHFWSPEE